MQIIEAPPAPLSLTGIFSSLKLTAAESKTVAAAQAKVADIHAIIDATEPDRHSRFSELHGISDKAEQVFASNITRENAEALHEALVRLRDAEVSFGRIDAVCHQGLTDASQSAREVADAVAKRAADKLETEAATHRTAMDAAAATFGEDHELSAFDQRLVVTRNALEGELVEVHRDPLHWLASKGFA